VCDFVLCGIRVVCVMCCDECDCDIAGQTNVVWISFFMITYILLAGIVLTNIVVAVRAAYPIKQIISRKTIISLYRGMVLTNIVVLVQGHGVDQHRS